MSISLEPGALPSKMIVHLSTTLLILQLFSLLEAAGRKPHHTLYKDPHAPVETRVNDLLHRMTIDDKMAQLIQGTLYLRNFVLESMLNEKATSRTG